MALADQDRNHLGRTAWPRAQLQHQAFRQVARTDAGRLQALQQAVGDAQPVQQLLALLGVLGQGGSDLVQSVFEVAVFVQRFDQHLYGGPILGRQVQAGELLGQVLGQRGLGGFLALALAVIVAAAGAAAGRQLADAVEVVALGAVLPVLALGAAEVLGAQFGGIAALGLAGRGLGAALGRRVRSQLGRADRELLLRLQQRVAGEHLLDLLVQLQRRQLQQPDRLLQLWRQRQVLTEADLESLLHAAQPPCGAFGPSAGLLPSRPAMAMCLRLDAASIAVPSGAEAGHRASRGRPVPAEELRRKPQRGLQDRLGWPAFSAARLGEGPFHHCRFQAMPTVRGAVGTKPNCAYSASAGTSASRLT
mmetsp:Transcript_42777/g.69785  ORF Transcript_42777/g.69785 Transcript_42777/m.69785 type:complete len:363 (-) Transcript_42777:210-1298(-)